uniref:Uncharacterized protein n=1 Tax=viral metagenome TaxID=1070528 RepID=A0A6H2A5J9_9ZZZZ
MNIFLKLVPFVLQMMNVAEKFFSGREKSGEDKKQMVVGATKAVVGSLQAISTGGQKETWDQLEEPVSDLVDGACDVLFNSPTADKKNE